MREVSSIVLATSQATEEGKSSNFLIPNGTFFFVLAIFLVVLGVIGIFVVPPILKVLRERDAMVAKTHADNKMSAEQFAAAQTDYEAAMKEARVQASSFRDNARVDGRKFVEEACARAEQQVMLTLHAADEQLKRERDAVELDLRANMGVMSAILASRILGVNSTASVVTR
ncbi:F0F1 ATP synthase subunit B [Mycobacterium uberis]|uniref:ATP synthase subunit b n=1 Tax=Mycobacterium uberis TaxID=2162698 RepID=A0A3E1HCJ9_9MYCO|nr:F0F1 ATP synthase subunit B [Mycobacterium uberis]RFD24201.1 F0F1 ATP synthase subunit B [Mycobacterium uberis]